MYNRYVPQSDGTFVRKRIPDPTPPPKPEPAVHTLPPTPDPPPQEQPRIPKPEPPKHFAPGLDTFFRQLLPRGFDTGDLIVVLLLLLMAADCPEDQNTALLTLALYLFL